MTPQSRTLGVPGEPYPVTGASMKTSDLNTIGLNMMYKSTQTTIPDTTVAVNFANSNTNEAFMGREMRGKEGR